MLQRCIRNRNRRIQKWLPFPKAWIIATTPLWPPPPPPIFVWHLVLDMLQPYKHRKSQTTEYHRAAIEARLSRC